MRSRSTPYRILLDASEPSAHVARATVRAAPRPRRFGRAGARLDPRRHRPRGHDAGDEAAGDRGGGLDRADGGAHDRLGHSRAHLDRDRRADRCLGASPAGRRAGDAARHLAVRRPRQRVQAQSQHPRLQRGAGGRAAAGGLGVPRRRAAERAGRGRSQLRPAADGARAPGRAAERVRLAARCQLARRRHQPDHPARRRPARGRARAVRGLVRRWIRRGVARRRHRGTHGLLRRGRLRARGRLARGHRRAQLQRLRQPRPARRAARHHLPGVRRQVARRDRGLAAREHLRRVARDQLHRRRLRGPRSAAGHRVGLRAGRSGARGVHGVRAALARRAVQRQPGTRRQRPLAHHQRHGRAATPTGAGPLPSGKASSLSAWAPTRRPTGSTSSSSPRIRRTRPT